MVESGCRLSLKYRLIFYLGGFLFAAVSYSLGIWAYGVESASWGDVEFYRKLVANFFGTFQSHSLSFFIWELVCTGIALTIGHLFDREVYYRHKAEERANVDGLTGVYNHRYFQERLGAEIERANRYGRSLSLIMLDIDDFKHFNDTWGHQEGDKLLVLFTALCGRCVRTIDVIARYGGEEFVIILPETSADDAMEVAERIRECTEKQTISAFGKNKGTTVSAGVACFPENGATRHALTLNADAAMYCAKRNGKNRCFTYDQEQHRSYRAASSHITSAPDEEDIDAIGALGATVDAKDIHTKGHSFAVMQMATLLGERLSMSSEEIGSLRVAALLHDIGKLGTPQTVLEKPDPLDADDWRQIENHAGLGSRILSRVQQMGAIGPGVKHHHERYDGKGYPNGLAGKNIPLLARIIAIADSFDAMTSDRSYRGAKSQEEAVEELRRCAGTQFDPELVEAFIAALNHGSDADVAEAA